MIKWGIYLQLEFIRLEKNLYFNLNFTIMITITFTIKIYEYDLLQQILWISGDFYN